MFVSFLIPHVDRGAGPLFHLTMLLQMSRFAPDEICFIGDEAYFAEEHVPFGEELALGSIRFTCVSQERYRAYGKAALPFAAVAALYAEGRSHLDAFGALLTAPHAPLVAATSAALDELGVKPEAIEAFLTWSNCPSLSALAAGLGKPVIHNELGPLRGPVYQDTVFFDFNGVNGNSTPATAWRDPAALAAQLDGAACLTTAQLRALLYQGPVPAVPAAGEETPARYRLGVALQVEDDSNTLAYGRGYDAIRLLYQAQRDLAPEQVLVRSHPSARLGYRGGLGQPDDSPSSLAFLGRIEHLLTINSSVAAEAALWGVPYTVLGDTPFAVLSAPAGAGAAQPDEAVDLTLNALLLAYLVPATLLFDPDYYRWRLAGAGLRDCFARHLEVFKRHAIHAQAGLPPLAERSAAPAPGAAPDMPHRNAALWSATRSVSRSAAALTVRMAELETQLAAAIAERDKNWEERCWFQENLERVEQELGAAREQAAAAQENLTLSLKVQHAFSFEVAALHARFDQLGEQLIQARNRYATAEAQSNALIDELNRTMLERIEALAPAGTGQVPADETRQSR